MIKVIYYFSDNNNRVAQYSLNLSDTVSLSDASIYAIEMASRLALVTNAKLDRFEIRKQEFYQAVPAGFDVSNVYHRGLLLFTGGTETHSIQIPSVTDAYFELSGDYAGFRITESDIVGTPFEAIAQLLIGNVLTVGGEILNGQITYVAAMENTP